jgi:hypothetical protein
VTCRQIRAARARALRAKKKTGWVKSTADERFEACVDRSGQCWMWTGLVLPCGYGRLSVDGKQVYAHRYSYEQTVGPIPEGLELDHLCRVRACVNPNHLEPVTRRENIRRGVSVVAANAVKTHCRNGHPFDEANTYIRANGGRECRPCRKQAWLEWKARQGAAA